MDKQTLIFVSNYGNYFIFTGRVPLTIGNLSMLRVLYLSNSNFGGMFNHVLVYLLYGRHH
jgi:hypothetical protein